MEVSILSNGHDDHGEEVGKVNSNCAEEEESQVKASVLNTLKQLDPQALLLIQVIICPYQLVNMPTPP